MCVVCDVHVPVTCVMGLKSDLKCAPLVHAVFSLGPPFDVCLGSGVQLPLFGTNLDRQNMVELPGTCI